MSADITLETTETLADNIIALKPAPAFGRSILTMSQEQVSRLEFLAKLCANSRLSYAKVGRDNMAWGDIFLIMAKGIEIGLEPLAAMSSIDMIGGTPCLDGQGQLALIYRSGLLENIAITGDDSQCTVSMKRKDLPPHTETFTMDMARSMKTREWRDGKSVDIPLADKSNWKQMPGIMLKWRAVAAAARVLFPDVIGGLYTQEEIAAGRDDVEINVTPDGQMTLNMLPAPKPNGTNGHNGHVPTAAYLATDAGRARLTELLDELRITDYAPYLAQLDVARFSETTLPEADLHDRIREIHAALNNPAPEPITDLEQLQARCEAELAPDMTKREIARLAGIDDYNDLELWTAAFGTLDKAYDHISTAFAKSLPPAKPQRAVDGPVWGDFDTHQINEDAREFYNLTPEHAREVVGKDWTEFTKLSEAQAALRAAVQRDVLPMIARSARYMGQYTEFDSNPKVRLYGRDLLRNLGDDWQQAVDAWESRKTYELPEPLLIHWKPAASNNYLEVTAVSTLVK